MHLKYGILVLALSLAATAGCATTHGPAETLGELQVAMRTARTGHDVGRLPAVEGLVGLRRAALVNVLGAPRDCRMPLELPCRNVGETVWAFYDGLHDHEPGPVLVVRMDPTGQVLQARWRHGELGAPAPLAPSSGGEAVAVGSDR
jgi:hypothetical protein